MKNVKFIYVFLFVTALFASCEDDDRDTDYVNGIAVPSNLELQVTLTQDNTGVVALTPSGESVAAFNVQFGDSSEAADIVPGESVSHVYEEGTFTVTVLATNLNGDSTSLTREVIVSFLPPENLEITITPVSGDAFSIDVSAMADFSVGFEVYFGDVVDEAPTPLMMGEAVMHTYAEVGTYTVRVVALAGGAATIEDTVEVVIINPILLPIDFESTSIEYSFIDFGGAITTLADNPNVSGENTSTKVAQFFKENGAEVFAGTVIELGGVIDFTALQDISISSLSPTVGATVKLKLENGVDPTISAEIDATTAVANAWETLYFDFSGADLTQEYSKVIVFYDFGNVGTGTNFFFDNIMLSEGVPNTGDGVTLPLDFEDDTLDYGIIGFEGADSAIEANPFMEGINTSEMVLRTIKTDGAQFYAGTVVGLDTPIDFTTTEMIKFKSYSPKAGIPVKLRLENADNSVGIEVDVNTTVVDEWEELIYDFSGMTAGADFVRVVVFYEFIVNLPGDGSTYYFDDITLEN
jgi:hypothetical protein